MNGAVLELFNSFNDLGIIFDHNLDLRNHITSTVFSSLCYQTIVYHTGTLNAAEHSDKIESVQKQFLLFCLRH